MEDVRNRILLENKVTNLFRGVVSELIGRYQSFQLMLDDNFVHRRDRTSNDVHLFLELDINQYFHLRAYVRHMLKCLDVVDQGKILLTGYYKDEVKLIGGEHSFEQKWYECQPNVVAEEIITQNPQLFIK